MELSCHELPDFRVEDGMDVDLRVFGGRQVQQIKSLIKLLCLLFRHYHDDEQKKDKSGLMFVPNTLHLPGGSFVSLFQGILSLCLSFTLKT